MKLDNIWYGRHPLAWILLPLSWLFCTLTWIRRRAYHYGILTRFRVLVPVIVVGNITVGGTGKTPLVIWLGQFFRQQGFKPGIVSRGYRGHAKSWPQLVHSESDPFLVGDEPVLLARQSGCPVAVAPQRIQAVQSLLQNSDCNLIISDDGLQHYALQRNIEIAVLDGDRGCGNHFCLPAGPLREPVKRLKEVNFLVIKGNSCQIKGQLLQETKLFPITMTYEYSIQNRLMLRHVMDDNILQPVSALGDNTVHAVTGIGHPAQFFAYLRAQGLKLYCHEFPDHHPYCQNDIQFDDDLPVIMTEKDAVKCRYFATHQHWYLPVTARLPHSFGKHLLRVLRRIESGQKIA